MGASFRYLASGVEAMITATWTWKDIRDFEETPPAIDAPKWLGRSSLPLR